MRRRSNLRYSLQKSRESQLIAGVYKFANTMEAQSWGKHSQIIAVINEHEENKDLVMVTDQLNNQEANQEVKVNPKQKAIDDLIIMSELEKSANLTSYMGTSYAEKR